MTEKLVQSSHEWNDSLIEILSRQRTYFCVKRLFDIAFSSVVLLCLSPLFVAVAIAIKLDDPKGPVVYVQDRVGKQGKLFRMYKFRSMVVDAEDRLRDLQHLNEKTYPLFKIADDPRITRVGKFIRRTSFDEMPQFFNVLLGDMSVVGPRPALPVEVSAYNKRQMQRLLVKPGITCYWQTCKNRDSIDLDEWVNLDLWYLQTCSIWTDIKLVLKTVGVVLTFQGN